ncbi:uncharacterized protein LOC143448656 isoform X1 [Clavelina lepadiformis]|uniref:uncharacterized protein LOC143448656 isoform X1 n=1 Tax=Clavelina lepadiformis TaxID=159417 RepID=UPI00404208F0
MTNELVIKTLPVIVAQICQCVGFDSIQSGSLEVLVDVLKRFLEVCAISVHKAGEQCGSNAINIQDVKHGFDFMHVICSELLDYMQQMEIVQFKQSLNKFPISKRSNLQFPSALCSSSLDHVYSYFPLLVNTAQGKSDAKLDQGVISDDPLLHPLFSDHTFTIAGKQHISEDEDHTGSCSSENNSFAVSSKNISKDTSSYFDKMDEPLWIKQHAAKLENETAHRHVSKSVALVEKQSQVKDMDSSAAEMIQDPSQNANRLGQFGSKVSASKFMETSSRSNKAFKAKESITSRIEEVDKLLQYPILKKDSNCTSDRNMTAVSADSTIVKDYPVSSESSYLPTHTASPKTVDDAIDAVIRRASKEADEAELMKFSHLIENSSSSDDDGDNDVSHKAEQMLQLEQRGFHKHVGEESPVRPPLTPSPSTNYLIDHLDLTHADTPSVSVEKQGHKSSLRNVWENMSNIKDKVRLGSSDNSRFEQHHKKNTADSKNKKLKKSKTKSKSHQNVVSYVKTKTTPEEHKHGNTKSVEKLILKKSKGGEAKVVKMPKEKEVNTLADRTPVPKLSAAVVVPQARKKEKKRKKDKTFKSSKKIKEDFSPIPKLTFKVASTNKKISIVKPSSSQQKTTNTSKVSRKHLDKVTSNKDLERKVITETISVGSGVGIVYDAQGNRVWICPACSKPDDGSPMIGCDQCDGWYHWPCVGIVREPEKDEWFCPTCSKKRL